VFELEGKLSHIGSYTDVQSRIDYAKMDDIVVDLTLDSDIDM